MTYLETELPREALCVSGVVLVTCAFAPGSRPAAWSLAGATQRVGEAKRVRVH